MHRPVCKSAVSTAVQVPPFVSQTKALMSTWEQLKSDAEHAATYGNNAEAEVMWRRALKLAEEFPKGDKRLSLTLDRLGEICFTEKRYTEAEPLFRRSLALRESTLGFEHPDVATSLTHLFTLCYVQGRFDDAEPLGRRVLTLYQKAFGEQHEYVAACLHNLAKLEHARGNFTEAEPLFIQALNVTTETLGADSAEVGGILNDQAMFFVDTNRLEEAEYLFRRSIQIREAALGPAHPEVVTTLSNLSTSAQHCGKGAWSKSSGHGDKHSQSRKDSAIRA
jgi:tetratricopeptide (TPR) repeat protein